MSMIAFQNNFQYAFMFSSLVWCHYGSPWLQESAQGKFGNLALEACRAFSMTLFGHHYLITHIEIEGAKRYGIVVRTLATQVYTASPRLLVPIMILLLQAVSIVKVALP
jgi:hypothetical protein